MSEAAASALIEDYFEVNDVEGAFPDGESDLVDPFCVSEPGVFIFQLNVNYVFADTGGAFASFTTSLLINGAVVASSQQRDTAKPENVALFYQGDLAGDATIAVIATATD